MSNATNPSLREQAEALLTLIESTHPDPEPFYIGEFVRRLLAHYGSIAVMWSTEDVKIVRPDLTDEQAFEVLEEVGRKHDAEWGISWTTLGDMADSLFGRAPKTDEA